jgi:predicted dehydrogenase
MRAYRHHFQEKNMAIEGTTEVREKRIRLGMVGGGSGAFIGAVHRMAARLDDHFELVAGALSSTPEKAKASGAELGLDPTRSYSDFREMAIREAKLKNGIEAVAIVTPNHVHYEAAKEFLKRGIHVICDKPLTSTLADAKKMKKLADESDALFVLTHNYTGYPMVRQARAMVANGDIGAVRLVQMEYPQDWLTENIEQSGQKQAAWRTDPKRSGAGGCIGDIGTHAFNLLHYVTGLKTNELAAELSSFVEGRALDDNVQVMLRLANGARGSLWASQVAPGNENGLRLRVYGSRGGLEWAQEHPNQLRHAPFGEPVRTVSRGTGAVGPDGQRVTRLPSGHPEGYLEAFATVYAEIAEAIRAARGPAPLPAEVNFPTIDDGIEGLAFIEAALRSSADNGRWVRL